MMRPKFMLVADTPEYHVQASPDLTVTAHDGSYLVTGRVVIPSAKISPKDLSSSRSTSPDERIVGERAATEPPAVPRRVRTSVDVVLGDDVRVDTYGLKARLGGQVRVSSGPGEEPHGTGEIRVLDGEYKAFGVYVKIVRGVLTYRDATLASPTIDLVAEREIKDEDITVSVNARGPIDKPLVTITSKPVMPSNRRSRTCSPGARSTRCNRTRLRRSTGPPRASRWAVAASCSAASAPASASTRCRSRAPGTTTRRSCLLTIGLLFIQPPHLVMADEPKTDTVQRTPKPTSPAMTPARMEKPTPPAEAPHIQERGIFPGSVAPGLVGPKAPVQMTAPTSSLSAIQNAMRITSKSVSVNLRIPPNLPVTVPVEISVFYSSPFQSKILTQTYSSPTGVTLLYRDAEGNGQPRPMNVEITMRELVPNGQVSGIHKKLTITPLYDVAISNLRFTMVSSLDGGRLAVA